MLAVALAAAARRTEQRTIQRLIDAGATTAERAILLTDGHFARAVRGRLERAGALQSAGNDRYFLRMAAYERFQERRRMRVWIIVTILMLGVVTVYFSGGFA